MTLLYQNPQFSRQMQSTSNPIIPTNDAIKNQWNSFAPVYSMFDATMQTFYYTLVNMLDIKHADHILEIASGVGRLIPYTSGLKRKEYISQTMIELSKKYLQGYLEKIGVQTSVEKWMESNHLSYRVIDGQKSIDTPYKFDRIICNLVLMITEDPRRMLQNLTSVAGEGGLLGLTIWGDKKLSNFMTLPVEAMKELGIPVPNLRENFHLYKKIECLAEECGWEVVIQWQQNAPFSHFELNDDMRKLIKFISKGHIQVARLMEQKVKKIFEDKNTLNFPVQMAILRKR